jgi:hypothetical protein
MQRAMHQGSRVIIQSCSGTQLHFEL